MKKRILFVFCFCLICLSNLYSQNLLVAGTENDAGATNGYYIPFGTQNGYNRWKHQTNTWYIYNDVFSGSNYWAIDNNTDLMDNAYFFIQSNSATPPSSGWTNGIGSGNPSISSTSLPVELTSFTGVALGNVVNLNWATATEVNNYGFNVERFKVQGTRDEVWEKGTSASLSASWETLGFVQGHGNSNSPKSYSFEDKKPLAGKIQYRLKQIDFDGAFEYSPVVDITVDAPVATELRQNFPNPFNPETVISYKVQATSYVTLKVFDMLGRDVATLVDDIKQPGSYQVNFNTGHVERSRNMPSGIYYYKLQAGNFVSVKKMLLIK